MDKKDNFAYWSLPISTLLDNLNSSSQGLDAEIASQRLDEIGPNSLSKEKGIKPIKIFLNQFKNPIMVILLVATTISLFVQDWVDAVIIFLIVFGSAYISFFQEYKASNAVEELKATIALKAQVLRNGVVKEIPVMEIVPGDIISLSAGSLIPADGVLIETQDFFVNQAVLTGETFPVEKKTGGVLENSPLNERTNCVYMGTSVRSGIGKMIAVKTGRETEFGNIAKSLNLRPPETDFEHGIRRFGQLLVEMMLVIVVVIFVLNVYFKKPVLDSLLFSIALAVGLTPQLLPAIIGINLSKGSQMMAKAGVIVRKLNAIEDFGSMDTLCTDKTGTLTKGVVRLDNYLNPDGEKSDRIFRLAYINASLQSGLSNPLDQAISAQEAPDINKVNKLAEIPYDFIRKRLSVVVQDSQEKIMITKGALENILKICDRIQQSGKILTMEEDHREKILSDFTGWSEQGFRVLGLATKTVSKNAKFEQADEQGMVFEGCLLFFDPPKPDVAQTISQLNDLGVDLKVISGDNKLVTVHVAEMIGLQIKGVLTGDELDNTRDDALLFTVENCNLFVEVDPNQKERIIDALKKRGHVVGYMGDGINDAPSLHDADVGISVDSAVDVAKDAADFVLMKQDLDVLRQGIILGRKTFANTIKYIFVTTSANFGNMFSMAGASLIIPFLPLLPFQVLLTNFMTDFPAMSIAGDSVDQDMIVKPRRWNIAFIRKFMIVFGLISSAFDFIVFGILLMWLKVNQDSFRTGWFLVSVLTELLIMLVIRTKRPFFQSRPGKGLLYSTLIVALFTLCLPYIPGLNKLLGFSSLPWGTLWPMLVITAVYIIVNEIAKRFFYKYVEY